MYCGRVFNIATAVYADEIIIEYFKQQKDTASNDHSREACFLGVIVFLRFEFCKRA